MERERLIDVVARILQRSGLKVARVELRGGCFDLVASGLFTLLFIKVVTNIDTVTQEQAEDLKRLAKLFKATPMIVGIRTKNSEIEEGVIYERFGIYALNPATLYRVLVEGEFPAIFAERGGLYVRINGELLRKLREKHGYSVGELASLLGVSRKSLLNYERNEQAVSLEVALRMEELFDEPIAEPIDVLRAKVDVELKPAEPETPLERDVFEKLKELGMGVVKVKRAPFNALSREEEVTILTGIDERKTRSTVKRAEMVAEVGRIINTGGLFVLEKSKMEVVSEVPLIPKESLKEIKDVDELIELIEGLKKEIKKSV
ncbi:transcriptional regulator [Thermococcus sp. AM4]|uniref:transcriptional regulator n=1 Tax=Thermococcus sp. (strain AM4) TaxID=246969 RepID=UPI00018707FE|nr:transcriptional regulator [Thermococcus sp. AM4]EEB73225.1 transcriptional regulator, XRE family [Thermococcus sp. AM4]